MRKPPFSHRPLGIVTNLFGGPGVGKSTLALGIAFELKRLGWEAQIVQEEAKVFALVGHQIAEPEQFEVTWKAYEAERKFYGKVDFIIVEAPLELQAYYGYHRDGTDDWLNIVKRLRGCHMTPRLNFWVEKTLPYETSGRYQDEVQANYVHQDMGAYLDYLDMTSVSTKEPVRFVHQHLLPKLAMKVQNENYCHAGRDGECCWVGCPQLRDNEPVATGRHCPLDTRDETD